MSSVSVSTIVDGGVDTVLDGRSAVVAFLSSLPIESIEREGKTVSVR
jgi:hypothetical protein